MKIKEQHTWTKEELKFLKDNWETMQGKDIAKEIGLSLGVVMHKRFELKLPNKRPTFNPSWRKEKNPKKQLCVRCNKVKKAKEFHKRSKNYSGLSTYCKECKREIYFTRGKKRKQDRERFQRYGVTPEKYQELLEKQQGVCAICGKLPNNKTKAGHLSVDHDHKTGEPRGLLCDRCNTALGGMEDNPKYLQNALNYLK